MALLFFICLHSMIIALNSSYSDFVPRFLVQIIRFLVIFPQSKSFDFRISTWQPFPNC